MTRATRGTCADQSVVRETLNSSTELNVQQMQQAIGVIFRQHSAAYRHNYKERPQLLDVDMTGMPCGPHREGSRTGYFGENNIGWGRQPCSVFQQLAAEKGLTSERDVEAVEGQRDGDGRGEE